MPDGTARDEQKTERFNMFFSPSEMKAIDDWAWQNRVRSKSEAVRRLVQIGLGFDAEAQKLVDATISAINDYETSSRKVVETMGEHSEGDPPWLPAFVEAVASMGQTTAEDLGKILQIIGRVEVARAIMKAEGTVDDALIVQQMTELQEIVEPFEKLISDYESRKPKDGDVS
ncbi:hypothetical protein [Rhizobium leguminosarum]|uniref:hypothetical protein n=1 Tax=Rhizobium leguminosarum TaxID=384 RepID=UPI001031121D|nr:hypothetical protein [Rhizobium leguminosarum]TBG03782.1 hypothetical protein ELG82_09625 [Rhizobium leguminosarum]